MASSYYIDKNDQGQDFIYKVIIDDLKLCQKSPEVLASVDLRTELFCELSDYTIKYFNGIERLLRAKNCEHFDALEKYQWSLLQDLSELQWSIEHGCESKMIKETLYSLLIRLNAVKHYLDEKCDFCLCLLLPKSCGNLRA
ncbi:hypothetical protein MTBPR1_60234 [Candidatus Terasakiella magnetica]|uniref:Uncharacterized protein n=1 Tax=Candidatus Terasakiella magnetica TaxID=1867952 RepID=A0A1C3RKH5_9PROT|nr:hypothetical protein [Candidatus Terasakiella magnetica]SCA57721.1 hypothetical protein MTBPR1_60234 [Candidatus Terasakiella magnetica]